MLPNHPQLPPPWLLGRGLVLLVAAAALVTSLTFYVLDGSFVLTRLVSTDWKMHTDFETFWQSARALVEGRDIYETSASVVNLNPPVASLVFAPLGRLDFWPAYRAFTLLCVALVVASMATVAAELRVRPAAAIAVTTGVLVSSPVLATLGLGQIYPLLMAGLAPPGSSAVAAMPCGPALRSGLWWRSNRPSRRCCCSRSCAANRTS